MRIFSRRVAYWASLVVAIVSCAVFVAGCVLLGLALPFMLQPPFFIAVWASILLAAIAATFASELGDA